MNIKLITGVITAVAVSAFADINVSWDFEGDGPSGTELQGNLSGWNYTSGTAYVASNATANTLAFNSKSSSADYIIRNKGGDHKSVLGQKTQNTANGDFGVYLQKLDFTNGGQNDTQITRVSWSFDILGYDQNGNLDPSNWTVKISYANNSQNLNISDVWFNGAGAAVAQTFSFNDDSTSFGAKDGTWTTVSGSYDIAAGEAGSVGGIQISTDGGGYTSGGGIFYDNISVNITSIPEPATLGMIGAFGGGLLFIRRRFLM